MLITGCKKENTSSQAPVITDINVLSGLPNSAVTITGSGFNTVLANDSVTFNGVAGTINAVTPTKIIVTVPAKATNGKIKIYINGTTITYPTDFKVISVTQTTRYNLQGPYNMSVDAVGNVYGGAVGSLGRLSPSGIASSFVNIGYSYTTIGGTAVDAAGNIYATASYDGIVLGNNIYSPVDCKVYKISPMGTVTTFAGNGVSGYADGQGGSAQFTTPTVMTIDVTGNLYVADVHRIRKITPNGLVGTIAGNDTNGNVDGQGTSATFGNIYAITTDAAGNIYLADNKYGNLRKISPSGTVTTLLDAIGKPISFNFSGAGGMVIDAAGNIFVAVKYGGVYYGLVYMINTAGVATHFADGNCVALDPQGDLYISSAYFYLAAPYGGIYKDVFK